MFKKQAALTEHMANKEPITSKSIIPFQQNTIKGSCLPEFTTFPLLDLPWGMPIGQATPECHVVKRTHTRRVIRVTWTPSPDKPPIEVYAKRYKVRSLPRAFLHYIYPPKAKREFQLLVKMQKKHIPCPCPLLWGTQKEKSLLQYSYLLTESLGNEVLPLKEFWVKHASEPERDFILTQCAVFLRAAHDRGFYHDDCSTSNIAINVPAISKRINMAGAEITSGDSGSSVESPLKKGFNYHAYFASCPFYFIDVDQCKLMNTPLSQFRRLKNIFQVFRSLRKSSGMTPERKLSFLETYWGKLTPKKQQSFTIILNRIAKRKIGCTII